MLLPRFVHEVAASALPCLQNESSVSIALKLSHTQCCKCLGDQIFSQKLSPKQTHISNRLLYLNH